MSGRYTGGERIGAWLSADDDEVRLLGYGVYVGEEVPPAPVGFIAAVTGAKTWAEFDAVMTEDGFTDVPRPTNPKLRLDDGTIVWGAECWWGPEERMQNAIKGRRVVQVSIEEARRQADG